MNSTDTPYVVVPKTSVAEARFAVDKYGNAIDAAAQSATAITPSDTVPVTPGTSFVINCTVAGNVKVGFPDASTLTIAVAVGTLILPWAVAQVFVTGTTATATYANLS